MRFLRISNGKGAATVAAPFFVVYFVGDAVALSIFGSMLNIRTIIFNCIQTHYEMCDSCNFTK